MSRSPTAAFTGICILAIATQAVFAIFMGAMALLVDGDAEPVIRSTLTGAAVAGTIGAAIGIVFWRTGLNPIRRAVADSSRAVSIALPFVAAGVGVVALAFAAEAELADALIVLPLLFFVTAPAAIAALVAPKIGPAWRSESGSIGSTSA